MILVPWEYRGNGLFVVQSDRGLCEVELEEDGRWSWSLGVVEFGVARTGADAKRMVERRAREWGVRLEDPRKVESPGAGETKEEA